MDLTLGLGVRGLSVIKVAVMGAVVVAVVGALLAHMGENELKELWEKNYINVNVSYLFVFV